MELLILVILSLLGCFFENMKFLFFYLITIILTFFLLLTYYGLFNFEQSVLFLGFVILTSSVVVIPAFQIFPLKLLSISIGIIAIPPIVFFCAYVLNFVQFSEADLINNIGLLYVFLGTITISQNVFESMVRSKYKENKYKEKKENFLKGNNHVYVYVYALYTSFQRILHESSDPEGNKNFMKEMIEIKLPIEYYNEPPEDRHDIKDYHKRKDGKPRRDEEVNRDQDFFAPLRGIAWIFLGLLLQIISYSNLLEVIAD